MRLGARARSPPLERPALRWQPQCWYSRSCGGWLNRPSHLRWYSRSCGGWLNRPSHLGIGVACDRLRECEGRSQPPLMESTSIETENVEQAARVEGTWREHRAASDAASRGASETRRERRGGEGSAEQAAVPPSKHPRSQTTNDSPASGKIRR